MLFIYLFISRMRWAVHIVRTTKIQNVYKISNWNLALGIQHDRMKSKLEDNIKIDHRVTECYSVDRNQSAQDRVNW
jgi:hypothetical protein